MLIATHTLIAVGVGIAGLILGNPLLQERAVCNADNCDRQVTETSSYSGMQPLPRRSSDCASFLGTTVAPAPVVSTVTSTTATCPASQDSVMTASVTVIGSSVPTYASLCGPSATLSARYSSACSCWSGITRSKITLPPATTTMTTYVSPSGCPCPSEMQFNSFNEPFTINVYRDYTYVGQPQRILGSPNPILNADEVDCRAACLRSGFNKDATCVYVAATRVCTVYAGFASSCDYVALAGSEVLSVKS